MNYGILLTFTLLILQVSDANAAIELRTVTRQTQAVQWLKFSISMKPHPNGSGATLVMFKIPADQAKRHDIHGASVYFKEGKVITFHAPLSLSAKKDGSLSAEVTVAKPLLESAWLGVHVYRKGSDGSGTAFNIDLRSYINK